MGLFSRKSSSEEVRVARRPRPAIVVDKAGNPDGSGTYVAYLRSEPRFIASGPTPLDAFGAFLILHHVQVGLDYVEVTAWPPPAISVNAQTMLAICKEGDGWKGGLANELVAKPPCNCRREHPELLPWTWFPPQPNRCQAAGLIVYKWHWALDIIIDHRTEEPIDPVRWAGSGDTDCSGACCGGDCGP